jgi:hypothetical protein
MARRTCRQIIRSRLSLTEVLVIHPETEGSMTGQFRLYAPSSSITSETATQCHRNHRNRSCLTTLLLPGFPLKLGCLHYVPTLTTPNAGPMWAPRRLARSKVCKVNMISSKVLSGFNGSGWAFSGFLRASRRCATEQPR